MNLEIVNTKLHLLQITYWVMIVEKIYQPYGKEMTKYGGIGLSANQIGLRFVCLYLAVTPLIEEGKSKTMLES